MSEAKNRTSNEVNIDAPSLVPVHVWRVDATSRHVAMRLYAEGSSDASVEAGEHAFRLAPEQARQIIRDLSAAVLALNLKMLAESNDAKDVDTHRREEADSGTL